MIAGLCTYQPVSVGLVVVRSAEAGRIVWDGTNDQEGRTVSSVSLARTLDDVYLTLSPEPLTKPEEMQQWYRDLNPVRGGGATRRMALGFRRVQESSGLPYKAFLMGHSGSGKSTEITRLLLELGDHFQPLRFSAVQELDPVSLRPFDVLLLTMIRIVEATALPKSQGGAGQRLPDARLRELRDWFSQETHKEVRRTQLAAEAGAGVDGKDGLLGQVLGLFAKIKAEARYATDRSVEVVEYRLRRLGDLIELANRVLDDCNSLLREATPAHKEWLIVWEDFDKPGFAKDKVEELFLTYANLWREIRCHLIITLPITLGWSAAANRLALPDQQTFSILDIPVYRRDRSNHQQGQKALERLLEARIAPELFAGGEMRRVMIASGGNVRDLFALVSRAADNALLDEGGNLEPAEGQGPPTRVIAPGHLDEAIGWLRTRYERRLGANEFDDDTITYQEKVDRMVAIYNGEPKASVPDSCLYSLLKARAVQEFNSERWLGLHPLAVDILKRQGALPQDAEGGTT